MKIKNGFVGIIILLSVVMIGGVVLQKTDAQVDVGVCQEEYNASRSKCITDNTACVAACGGNQTCELDCNTAKRNTCDDAAVARQKECLGVDNSASEKPVSSIQPDVAIDCQSTYDRDRAVCQNTANACYNSCKNGLSDNYWTCMETCTSRNTNCGKEARYKLSVCGLDAQSPVAKPKEQPPTQTMPPPKSDVDAGDDSDDPELLPAINVRGEIIVDGTFYTVALVDDAPTKIYFEKMISAMIEPGPGVSITLKNESLTAFTPGRDAGIDSNALVPKSTYNFMLNTSNLATVQPVIIFNDGTENKFSLNVGELTRSLGTSDTDTLGVDVDSLLQEKMLEIMKKNPPAKTATFSISKTSAKPLVLLSPAEDLTGSLPSPSIYSGSDTISAGASFMAYPGSLVVLDADPVNMNAPVMTVGGPAVTSQTRDFDDRAMSRADAVFEVKKGKAIVVAGWSAEDTLSATSDFISALENVEVRHRKTAYGMAIDPDSGKKIIEIYDGEIELFDRKTGAALITLATEFGKGIKRVEIDKDGIVKRQIAIPQSEWPAFVAQYQKTRSGAWLWILTILIMGGVGYLAYRKKDKLIGIIKKEPKQLP